MPSQHFKNRRRFENDAAFRLQAPLDRESTGPVQTPRNTRREQESNPVRRATEPQIRKIHVELRQRELTESQLDQATAQLEHGLSFGQASAWIDRLVELPLKNADQLAEVRTYLGQKAEAGELNEFLSSIRRQLTERGSLSPRQIEATLRFRENDGRRREAPAREEGPAFPDADAVPSGRYAVESADGELRFYHVWRGDRNPDYVKLYVQHGPDESEVPFSRAGYAAILQSIAVDPGAAAVRYGREIGVCSQCNRRLTNRLSRELGIGPVCGDRVHEHEAWLSVQREAREAIRSRGEDPNEEVVA